MSRRTSPGPSATVMEETSRELPGALVLSLDFELLWGVRDRPDPIHSYGAQLHGARAVIPRMLDLFEEFDVAATWAVVGFLFAESREELERFSPDPKPGYANPALSPYGDSVGENEKDDPLHFAPSLIDRIARTPNQEIATHTFSHYYCGEAGQGPESFRADLLAARVLAEKRGIDIRSIVFPRNQVNPRYAGILVEAGIRSYRGNPASRSWSFADGKGSRHPLKRLTRLADLYAGTDHGVVSWDSVPQASGLSDVRASAFVAPYRSSLRPFERFRLDRMKRRVRAAAESGGLIHLWWHPHNFGLEQSANLRFLRAVLDEFARCRDRFGMVSLSMDGVDRMVRSGRDGDDARAKRSVGP